MKIEQFIIELKKLGININELKLEQLAVYCDFLIEYNKHTNLTAIKDKESIYLKHFYDSLTIVKSIDLNKYTNLIDIGTGAGFPGMVLKILFPDLEVTFLDSNNKKITFLKELASKLNLKNIYFYHGRAEEFGKRNYEKYSIVISRAVSEMRILSELCLPLVEINGYFLAMKGSNINELDIAKDTIQILGGKIDTITNFELPIEKSERNIIKIKKVDHTPSKYPRQYDKIKKYPLKLNVK